MLGGRREVPAEGLGNLPARGAIPLPSTIPYIGHVDDASKWYPIDMAHKQSHIEPNAVSKSQSVSLAPLSFEDALKALVATPPMGEKQKSKPTPHRKKPSRRKPGCLI